MLLASFFLTMLTALSQPWSAATATSLPPNEAWFAHRFDTPQAKTTGAPVTPSLPRLVELASPIPVPTPLVLPQDAPPQIVDIRLSSTSLRSGDTVSGVVITSTNVTAVQLRFAGYSIPVPRAGFGVFSMTYGIPKVPFFARHGYLVQVVAQNIRGTQIARDLRVTLR